MESPAALAGAAVCGGLVARAAWAEVRGLVADLARAQSRRHAGPADLKEAIARAEPSGMRVAVIGTGISGTQAMKACLAEGIEPVGFESDADVGGFWRYKEAPEEASVYRSTHIDTDREMNCYGDRPWGPEKPLVLHNSELLQYMRENLKEFDCLRRIRLRTRVDWVTPKGRDARGTLWEVTSTESPAGGAPVTRKEVFDGVIVCTGRHGRSGYVPRLPGLEATRVQWMHSSRYKHAAAHGLEGKRVVVVGIGNSGCDVVTELAPVARQCWIVARSGGWVFDAGPHADYLYTQAVGSRGMNMITGRLPWYVQDSLAARFPPLARQEILNRHGLQPAHRFLQQHPIGTGIAGQARLHDELEKGTIIGKRGIQRFTERGVVFAGDTEETPVDCVVFATGYRQAVPFIDPEVVDMRYEREGNDVPLYKGCLPLSQHTRLGFINFVQAVTFMLADLHSRYLTRVFKGLIRLPPLPAQRAEVEAIRATLCAQYIDRQQLRVQHGVQPKFYEDLAAAIGCQPTLGRLLVERPTALWHAYMTNWQGAQYRLVGPGRMEDAEGWMERLYQSRYYEGTLPDGSKKPGPWNRGGVVGTAVGLAEVCGALGLLAWYGMKGELVGPRIQDAREVYERYAASDSVGHSRGLHESPEGAMAHSAALRSGAKL